MKAAVDVAIIGAGFAGLTAAIRLKERGTPFILFERADQVGGTWRENVYPGAACDIPSHLYSLSFAPNPNWSRTYSTQPELLSYLKTIVERYDLGPRIRYNTEITRAEFLPGTGCWTLTDQAGNATTARVLIVAVGPLNRPIIPKLKGLETFAGKTFHSSAWDTAYELTNKRVAVIGTGASAIQFIPKIAPAVKQLTVFQRTAPYITPRRDRLVSSAEQQIFQRLPVVQKAYRSLIYWINEVQGLSFLGNKTGNKLGTKIALQHLRKSIDDPELRRKATPNYTFGCKRVLISNDYYPALTRPNVELVTDTISEIRPDSIVDKNGTHYPVDAIIFGTGFMVSGMIARMNIIGRYGQNLFDQWLTQGAEAHYGITASGYPNLGFLVGPNTGLGHNSIIHMIESQVNYLLDYLSQLDRADEGAFLDVKPEAQQRFNANIQQKMAGTVWASGCKSWYLDAQGRNATLWPSLTVSYRKATRQIDPADYEVVHSPQEVPQTLV
ncbi:flavin-containing monooxygenase [Spirosoma agri]|uniref:NAD(P)/FAD-dependent oxidoreductase n=1 Tax=Spirosoma agri TaxID=1987381 RepID=A0A6M0IIP9_9BACT|nr:NAD(P)/FAD-dependent oxidoreductase [Spirosoma agri]NEU67241.1 NAD(P)/FAD-dependent oxidoreductase [Spirosoma agri]